MTQRYTPAQAERMKKRRYWYYVDDQRFSSAGAVNKYIGENLCHAAWRADLIAESGGERMQVGERTLPVERGQYTIVLERRKDSMEESMHDYDTAYEKLLSAGWSIEELESLDKEQFYTEYKLELARQRLNVPYFNNKEVNTHVQKSELLRDVFEPLF